MRFNSCWRTALMRLSRARRTDMGWQHAQWLRHLYRWLWPLFTACQQHGVPLVIPKPLYVVGTDGYVHLLMKQTVSLCPTPLMHGILVLAAIGAISLLAGLGYGAYKLDQRLVAEQEAVYRTWLYQAGQRTANPFLMPEKATK